MSSIICYYRVNFINNVSCNIPMLLYKLFISIVKEDSNLLRETPCRCVRIREIDRREEDE